MASPYDEFQQPAKGGDPYAEFQRPAASAAPAEDKPWIGTAPPKDEGMLSSIYHAPVYGVQDIGAGVKHLMQPGKRMQGAHEVISGVGRASIPLIAPAIAAYGAGPVALGLGGSMIGSTIGKTGASMLGANEDVANLAGDAGAIAGGIGAPRMPFKSMAAKALDFAPETDAGIRDVVGMASPRLARGLGVLQRAKDARAAYQAATATGETSSADAEMLDKVAQGFGYKNFASAPDAYKSTIQNTAQNVGKPRPAPPPKPPAPQPLPKSRQISAPPRVFKPEAPEDTSGVIQGYSPTILEQEPRPGPTALPASRQLSSGPNLIRMPEATDTSGPIPFNPPAQWSAKPIPREGTITVNPEAGDLRIKSPQAAPTGTIPVPKPTVEGAVEKLNVEPHEPYESYSPSRVERQMTPETATHPERVDYEQRLERLRKSFPHETEPQIRARADEAVMNKKKNANGGAIKNISNELNQSLGGK